RADYRASEAAFLTVLVLNLFPFTQGALNISRQFLAAAVLLTAYRSFSILAKAQFRNFRALVVLVALVSLASLFHRCHLLVLQVLVDCCSASPIAGFWSNS